MKKKIMLLIAALTVLLLFSTAAAAVSSGRGYIDSNNDGTCDNRSGYSQFSDQDGDGICDNMEYSGNCPVQNQENIRNSFGGYCSGYVDEDGDGICDNKADSRGMRNRCRCGRSC